MTVQCIEKGIIYLNVLYNDNYFMILYAGVSGVNLKMLNMYPKHNSKLSFQLHFRIIVTLKNVTLL